MDNLNKMGLVELKSNDIKKINGGAIKGWGWLGIAAYVAGEISDYVTSDGENLEEAYQNGVEAGLS